jgi:Ca-activated chloride channel family protein
VTTEIVQIFANPTVLVLVLLAPNVIGALFLYDWIRRERLTRRIGELPVLGRVMRTASPGRRIAKAFLQINAATCILIAIARPQVHGKRPVELRGLDLVVAVDVSKSMIVDDVEPTMQMRKDKIATSRLARARELAGAVIDELAGDRIGPVVFAGAASHFPLTEDREVAERFLNDLGPADLPAGSNLAEVFRVSRCLLRPDLYDDLGCSRIGRRGHGGDPLPGETVDPKDEARDDVIEQKVERGKAMLVFTDGGDTDEATLREVATARELGIAVFVVGMGTPAGGIVHEIDANGNATATVKTDKSGATVVSKRDDAGMKALAAAGGDDKRYFIAADRGELDPMPIVEALRAVNRGLATKKVDEKRDVFQPYLFTGLILLVIEAAISTRRRRRYPEEES